MRCGWILMSQIGWEAQVSNGIGVHSCSRRVSDYWILMHRVGHSGHDCGSEKNCHPGSINQVFAQLIGDLSDLSDLFIWWIIGNKYWQIEGRFRLIGRKCAADKIK